MRIDGKKVTASEGRTILDVASEIGIDIPTHCHKEPFEPTGVCRICLVEIRSPEGEPELHTACTYPVREGLEVKTDTERVKRTRKLTAELLLARCPDSEAVKKLAEEVGVEKTRFSKKDLDCTLCGLCSRACKTASGNSIITFVNRGPDREIITPFEIFPSECKGCGACAEICPTDAIEMVEVEDSEEK